jgi:hypothetical protein
MRFVPLDEDTDRQTRAKFLKAHHKFELIEENPICLPEALQRCNDRQRFDAKAYLKLERGRLVRAILEAIGVATGWKIVEMAFFLDASETTIRDWCREVKLKLP